MYKTVEYRVKITMQTVDGCGNTVEPPTAGSVRRALETIPMAESVTVEEVDNGNS